MAPTPSQIRIICSCLLEHFLVEIFCNLTHLIVTFPILEKCEEMSIIGTDQGILILRML